MARFGGIGAWMQLPQEGKDVHLDAPGPLVVDAFHGRLQLGPETAKKKTEMLEILAFVLVVSHRKQRNDGLLSAFLVACHENVSFLSSLSLRPLSRSFCEIGALLQTHASEPKQPRET